jgi:hypothetical protein
MGDNHVINNARLLKNITHLESIYKAKPNKNLKETIITLRTLCDK